MIGRGGNREFETRDANFGGKKGPRRKSWPTLQRIDVWRGGEEKNARALGETALPKDGRPKCIIFANGGKGGRGKGGEAKISSSGVRISYEGVENLPLTT